MDSEVFNTSVDSRIVSTHNPLHDNRRFLPILKCLHTYVVENTYIHNIWLVAEHVATLISMYLYVIIYLSICLSTNTCICMHTHNTYMYIDIDVYKLCR